ncbi:hypothetical protein GVAV_002931 [Gurleya vavrai]
MQNQYYKNKRGSVIKIIKNETNEIAVLNLSFKETEETIKNVFSVYGEIEKIEFSDPKSGKAKIKYKGKYNADLLRKEIIMSNKVLKIYRENANDEIKKETNMRRVFINHMDKSFKIIDVRNILREYKNIKVVDIKVKNEGVRKRNPGFCFVEFKSEEHAKWFVENFKDIRKRFGNESKVEFSIDKENKIKNKTI